MPLPEIFTLVSCPIVGELGPDTTVIENEPCPECGRPYRPFIVFLDYVFDAWQRAEFIQVVDTYAMTKRLFTAAQNAGLKGFSAREMKVTRGERMDPNIEIPEFVRFWVDGEADGPSGWWERGPVCPECGRVIWKNTDRLAQALFATKDEPGPARLVWPKSWEGEDIFTVGDPGPPVVTDRFKVFLEREQVIELVFAPARWAD